MCAEGCDRRWCLTGFRRGAERPGWVKEGSGTAHDEGGLQEGDEANKALPAPRSDDSPLPGAGLVPRFRVISCHLSGLRSVKPDGKYNRRRSVSVPLPSPACMDLSDRAPFIPFTRIKKRIGRLLH